MPQPKEKRHEPDPVNQFVRIFAGAFVLISLALGVEGSPLFVSGKFLWFTCFCRRQSVSERFHPLLPAGKHFAQGRREGQSAAAPDFLA